MKPDDKQNKSMDFVPEKNAVNVDAGTEETTKAEVLDAKKLSEKKKKQVIEGKLRKNRLYFYGLPFAVGTLILITIFVFAIPFFEDYPVTDKDLKTVNKSITNTNQTKANILKLQEDYPDIQNLLSRINERVPEKSEPGKIGSLIQEKAKDFNLEIKNIEDKLKVDNLTEEEVDENEKLIERLATGEAEFEPEGVSNPRIRVRRLYINLELSGTFENFKAFMDEIKVTDPIINLLSISYSESPVEGDDNSLAGITAELQFESFAAYLVEPKAGETEIDVSPSFDYRGALQEGNMQEIPVEAFSFNKKEIEGLLSGDTSVLGVPRETTTPQ